MARGGRAFGVDRETFPGLYFGKMNYRPSKSFVYSMVVLCPVVVALIIGLLPEVKDMEAGTIPGEITFTSAKPGKDGTSLVSARPGTSFSLGWTTSWFEKTYEDVMKWEHNPWKRNPDGFGDHFMELLGSKDPRDRAKARELMRLAEGWYERLKERYPELAITMRDVPDERNGFLQWLNFADRMKAPDGEAQPLIPFSPELESYLNQKGAWNAEAAKVWLTQQKALLDEIRAIGLLPDRSVNGIPVDRHGFIPARLAKGCADALMVEARLAAEEGDVAGALESVRAVKGLADHFGEVETPSLLAATVNILVQINLQNRVLNDIIPALSPGQIDPEVWENAVNPKVSSPAEFARLLKGEWGVTSRHYLLPMLLDGEDPKSPPDGGEMLDYYSSHFVDIVRQHEAATISDLHALQWPSTPDGSHLSRSSGQAVNMVFIGAQAWRKGWERAQSVSAMNQAAFAILQGKPIPRDPVYGAEYGWDPQTRRLSAPDTEVFREWSLTPVTVPKL